jgi:hypothetical protein
VKVIIKKIIIGLLAFISIILIIISAWAAIQHLRDPLDFIDQPISEMYVVQDSVFHVDFLPQQREYHALTLTNEDIGEVNCVISYPENIPVEGLPVVIILGGLEIGHYTLGYIPNPGRNIIIIYQYPYHPEYWYAGTAINEIPAIRKSVLSVPAQVLALRKWAVDQQWSDDNRLTILGYSFGALFIPAIYHLSDLYHTKINHGVIAYGGVDIYHMLHTNMSKFSEPWRSIISWLAFTAIRGIEPAFYMPHLEAEFLLINGTMDHQIPEECWRELHRLAPDPKTIMILEEGHMHQRKIELTKRLVRLSQEWLIQKNAVNP